MINQRRRSSRIHPSNDSESSFFATTSATQSPLLQPMNSNIEALPSDMDMGLSDGPSYIPPWTTPYVIGVGGASGSGKTSVASKLVQAINTPWTILVSLDNFYRPLTPAEREQAFQSNYDFDCPESVDLDACYECVKSIKEGKKTEIPVYSFVEHNRVPDKSITVYGASVLVVEGIYALHDPRLLSLMDLKIYVDTDLDICLARRLTRDIVARGRDLEGALLQWNRFVKPNADKYVKPTMKNADAIVPAESDNGVATNMLISHIQKRLFEKSKLHLAELEQLGYTPIDVSKTVCVLEKTNQIRGIHTLLLNKDTPRDDFVFYFDRIATILLNTALDSMPGIPTRVITPTNLVAKSVKTSSNICAINIIRSGDCFMRSLRKTIPSIAVGKLLIQSDSRTGEPQLHCDFMPPNIEKYDTVMLLDAQIISGAALIMAIQVLRDHGVALDKIKVVSYLATEMGLRRIRNAFGEQVQIYVGDYITLDKIEENNWSRLRFVDKKYFGS